MFYVSEHKPDCRVFVKRLITPNFTVDSQGREHTNPDVLNSAYQNYSPDSKKPDLIKKYQSIYNPDLDTVNTEISEKNKRISELNNEILTLTNQINLKDISPVVKRALEDQLNDAKAEQAYDSNRVLNLQKSISTIRPLYEPILLEVSVGVTSVNTSMSREGIGKASIVIKLPLEENGFYENILYAIDNSEMFNLDNTVNPSSAIDNMRKSVGLSSRELNIFKIIMKKDADGKDTKEVLRIDRRECSLLPHDMVQIWFTKRYSDNIIKSAIKNKVDIPKFPNDYIPAFTGFIKDTSIAYTGGQSPSYTITINCEDMGHILRITRANIDPSLDPKFRLQEFAITVFGNKLQQIGTNNLTGPQLIESLIVGKPGDWRGASQIEVIDDQEYDTSTGQHVYTKQSQTPTKDNTRNIITSRQTTLVSMPWEFDRIPFNAFEDLIAQGWQPYAATFKQAFKLWESDYKYRWEICKEIAEIMEYEFYADNFGALNYHPPLYNWNPANVKYFIENNEIMSESHAFSETEVVTSVEVVSQPLFGIPDNICKILSSFATASDQMIQRYGMRFRTKNIPVLSGTEKIVGQEAVSSEIAHTVRYLYAKAWLNRRNAKVQSGTIEIPGTPEMYLCNTVAFVDDINDALQKMATKPFSTSASEILKRGNAHLEVGSYGVNTLGDTTARDIVNNFKVYYVSGVAHKYVQGSSFTTSLTLTHGRRWGEKFNVGYLFTNQEYDELYEKMKEYLHQRVQEDGTFNLALENGIATSQSAAALASISANKQTKTLETIGNV